MLLESCQLLCSVFEPGTAPYRRTHYNHPCSIWVRTSLQNYEWLIKHAESISTEYTTRYLKIHKSKQVLNWVIQNYHTLNLPDIGLTKFAQAMPDHFKDKDAVVAYRNYYIKAKSRFAKWDKANNTPEWWPK